MYGKTGGSFGGIERNGAAAEVLLYRGPSRYYPFWGVAPRFSRQAEVMSWERINID
jgi:hypothetical protein